MKKKAFVIVLLAGFAVVIGVGVLLFIQNNKLSKKIQGAWSLQSMDVGTGEKRRTRDDTEFMMYIMEKSYSAIRDFTPGDSDGKILSLADRDFAADAGTYELDGKDLIVSHKISSFPVLGSMTFT